MKEWYQQLPAVSRSQKVKESGRKAAAVGGEAAAYLGAGYRRAMHTDFNLSFTCAVTTGYGH